MNRILSLIAALVLFFTLAACAANTDSAAYVLYYIDAEHTALLTEEYRCQETGVLETAQALIAEMENFNRKSGFAKYLVSGISMENSIARLNLISQEETMDAADEVLYRAALVKTLTQIDGIDYVLVYVNGAPITYPDGTIIGVMNASDFVDESDGKQVDLMWADLKLYYANAKGDKLVPTTVSVAYNKNTPLERVVVEQLIIGTGMSQTAYRTLPENLKLLGISVTDGTCYVNLDSAFLDTMVNVSANAAIYSIVNSLCELDSISRVQILVNGDTSKNYRESIPLAEFFSANMDVVQ